MKNALYGGLRAAALTAVLWTTPHDSLAAATTCSVPGFTEAGLTELRDGGFTIDDPATRNEVALYFVDCLGDPDPDLRDGIAFTGLATLLRGGLLAAETIQTLRERLSAMVSAADDSGEGFRRSFAVLALSEVARADRVEPVFTNSERAEMVSLATEFVRGVTDYRGFSDAEGWRHGVAHGSDLLMQLVLNPEVPDDAIALLVDAALSQVVPSGGHFYVFGESARLARPVIFAAQRGAISDEDWAARFEAVATPSTGAWSVNYSSENGLAELHNTRYFLLNVYASVAESREPKYIGLRNAARAALQKLP